MSVVGIARAGPSWAGCRRFLLRIIVGIASTGIALVAPSGSMAAATPVSPEVYAQAICGQAASLEALSAQLGAVVDSAVQAFQAQPTQANAIALRDATFALLDQTAQFTDELARSSQDAGNPDVKKGAKFAKTVTTHISAAAESLHALAEQAAAIDVSSPSTFAADFQAIGAKIKATQRRALKAAKRDPVFEHPPASLRPLVTFLTTDAPNCPTGTS